MGITIWNCTSCWACQSCYVYSKEHCHVVIYGIYMSYIYGIYNSIWWHIGLDWSSSCFRTAAALALVKLKMEPPLFHSDLKYGRLSKHGNARKCRGYFALFSSSTVFCYLLWIWMFLICTSGTWKIQEELLHKDSTTWHVHVSGCNIVQSHANLAGP